MEKFTTKSAENNTDIKIEHLKKDFYPIVACVGSWDEYSLPALGYVYDKKYESAKEIEEIVFSGENIEEGGGSTRATGANISEVNKSSKYTEGLKDCTSIIAVGREIDSDMDISFLTHQDSKGFLRDEVTKTSFVRELSERMRQLKEKCLGGSIDVVIVGGHFAINGDPSYNLSSNNRYKETLKLLEQITEEELGFKPTIIAGPKDNYWDNVYFDTQKRRLYIVRPSPKLNTFEEGTKSVTIHNDNFKTDDFENIEKKWHSEGNQ